MVTSSQSAMTTTQVETLVLAPMEEGKAIERNKNDIATNTSFISDDDMLALAPEETNGNSVMTPNADMPALAS